LAKSTNHEAPRYIVFSILPLELSPEEKKLWLWFEKLGRVPVQISLLIIMRNLEKQQHLLEEKLTLNFIK
jgi:hypothetical protein